VSRRRPLYGRGGGGPAAGSWADGGWPPAATNVQRLIDGRRATGTGTGFATTIAARALTIGALPAYAPAVLQTSRSESTCIALPSRREGGHPDEAGRNA
jgi:hypothetical protein